MKLSRILFLYPSFSSFVKNDYEIIKKYSTVKKYRYQLANSLTMHLKSQSRLLFWLLKNIWSAEKIYCWFADYHSFLPVLISKIIGKQFYLVLGGYDVVYLPELDYGSFKNPLRSFCAKFSIRHAEVNLAVSDYVKRAALDRVPEAKIITVYNGVNTELGLTNETIKSNIVLTVCAGDTLQRIRLKGLDFFCEVAKKLPQYEFKIIGVSEKSKVYFKEIPGNLEIIGKLDFHQLLKYYRIAKVYCQFSLVESFGLSLAESMLCECIPVGINVGGLPEVIGDTGYILQTHSVEEAAKIIEKALRTPENIGTRARQRIEMNYSLRIREKALRKILKI